MAGTPWTDQEKAVLERMAQAGKLMGDVLRVLPGRSRNGIAKQASMMGVSLAGKPPEIDMEEFNRRMGGCCGG